MNKRPKSREETPKEGSDSARRYRTAPICDRAAQSARPFEWFSMQISQGCCPGNKTGLGIYCRNFSILRANQGWTLTIARWLSIS
jgi:hypothetical protein